MPHAKFHAYRTLGSGEEFVRRICERVLPYKDIIAILVMRPKQFLEICVSLPKEAPSNLVLICQAGSEMFDGNGHIYI